MGVYSYYNEQELESYKSVKDKDLNELFQDVRNTISSKFYIQEREHEIKRPFKKTKQFTSYSLLYQVSHGECQIINFGNSDGGSGLNTNSSKGLLSSLLMGMLNGYEFRKREESKK